MDVGALIKQARWERDLTQRQLAARLGTPASTLSRYESGAALPSLTMLDRILAQCGKDLEATCGSTPSRARCASWPPRG